VRRSTPPGRGVNLGSGVNTPLFEGSIDISPDQRTALSPV
jgi:hypothetical protein